MMLSIVMVRFHQNPVMPIGFGYDALTQTTFNTSLTVDFQPLALAPRVGAKGVPLHLIAGSVSYTHLMIVAPIGLIESR